MDPESARKLLDAELADLGERLSAAEESRAEASADTLGNEGAISQHPGDYGSDVNTAMEAELGVDTVAEQRRRVVDAIQRLDEGLYGHCAVCGGDIDDERLEARPEAITCRQHADTPVPM